MSTSTEVPPSTSPYPPTPHPTRRDWRALRGMLIFVTLLLIASGVAILIAYATKGSSGPAGDIQATTVDYKIRMPSTLKPGKHTIGVTNDGKVSHEIVIFKTDLPGNDMPLDKNGDVDEESPQLTNVADSGKPLQPGESKSFTTASLTPGHYVALCNLPGHYRLGMWLNVTVS